MKSFTLTFSPDQLDIIARALAQMPYGMVAQLVAEIDRQVQVQASEPSQEAKE